MDDTKTISGGLRRWFRPPRAHGEVIDDRVVSFLELFYDLVFVVLIAQLAHTLADEVSWTGLGHFVVVFCLIWMAWLNGTLYHELHGGEDGRSRSYIFAQMSILVVLAVFTAHAADDSSDGRAFAIVYTSLIVLIAWQWFDVRRFDTEEWRAVAGRYVLGMVVIAGLVLVSAVIDDQDLRVQIWAVTVVVAVVGNLVLTLLPRSEEMAEAIRVTESLAERFGLFTIIVLGEVVVGVVDGLSAADHNVVTIATGLFALSIGFGFWWTYFDFVGGRVPRAGRSRPAWIFGHLPLALGVAAAGAGMVGLVEHAADDRTPMASAWLIAGATAAVALTIAALAMTIEERPGRKLVPYSLATVAVAALIVGSLRPTPWIMALALSLLLSAAWIEAFVRDARAGLSITDR